MAKIKFYVGDLTKYAKDTDTTEFADPGEDLSVQSGTRRDLHSIRVMESPSFDGTYQAIDTVKIQPGLDYIWAENASDDYLFNWYRLEFISDPSNPDGPTMYGRTEPIVPEDLFNVVDEVRDWLGDTNMANPAWSDKHYIQNIRFAVKQHSGERNLTFLREEDLVPIQLLVRETYANIIAYDHGKYYRMEAPAATLDKWQIGEHYLQIAEGLRQQYNAISKRLNLDNGGYDDDMIINQMPAANIVDAKRFSVTTGREVSSIKPNRFRRRNYFYDHVV